MTVADMIAALVKLDPRDEVFIVTSSDGRRLDGRTEVDALEELPLLGGETIVAVVPRYPVAAHRALAEAPATFRKTSGS